MDIIQTAATMALLTLLTYFVMVNILERGAIPSTGLIKNINEDEDAREARKVSKDLVKLMKKQLQRQAQAQAQPEAKITNQLDLDANLSTPIEGANTEAGYHSRTTVGEPVENGKDNTTTLSVFNKQAEGVLPCNHDLFEKSADFGSDVTNINQFYRNNPDIFNKSSTNVPDATGWDRESKKLFSAINNQKYHGPLNPYNFEQPVL